MSPHATTLMTIKLWTIVLEHEGSRIRKGISKWPVVWVHVSNHLSYILALKMQLVISCICEKRQMCHNEIPRSPASHKRPGMENDLGMRVLVRDEGGTSITY